MGCGICNTSTLMTPSFNQPGSLYLAPAVNPLGGTPLNPGQIIVTGPASTTCTQPDGTIGPRRTVVNVNDPATWPRWITTVNGRPADDGVTAGGCWQGQVLAPLTVTARRIPWWVWLLVVVLILAAMRRRD